MVITIDITPELEMQLHNEAARVGLDTDRYIVTTLEKHLHRARNDTPHLSTVETRLLQKVNLGLSQEVWQHYHELIAKRRAEILTPEEHATLITLSDQIEEANARRIEALAELARLRQTSLEELMSDLGLKEPSSV